MAWKFLGLIRYPNPNSPDLQVNTCRVTCKMPSFRKAKNVQKRKEQALYFLRATSRRQSGLFLYQITLNAYRIPLGYHSLKSKLLLSSLRVWSMDSCLRSPTLSPVYLSLIFQLSQTAVVKVEMSSTFPTVPVKLNNSQL